MAIAMESKFSNSVTDVIFQSERVIKIRVKCKNRHVTIIEAYAPTETGEEDEKDKFYEDLQELMDKTPRHDLIMVLGDFNAKVGNRSEIWGKTLGKHGVEGEENENGTRLLEFCSQNNLCITNTQFIQKPIRKMTWKSPDGKTENLIDYIITREEWMTSVKKTRVYRSAEIDSDHNLVVAEIKIKLEGKRLTTKKRYNTEKLKQPEVKERCQIKIQNKYEALIGLEDEQQDTETEWNFFKKAINEVAEEELGYRKTEKKKWITIETEQMIEEVNTEKNKLLGRSDKDVNKKEQINKMKELRKQLKRNLIKDKNKMLEEVAEEMEEASKRGDSKKLFACVNRLSGNTNSKIINCEPVKEKNGKLTTGKKEIMERWTQHFKELLNKQDPKNKDATEREIIEMEITNKEGSEESMEEEITLEEVEKAVKEMRKNKAPGICKITAEILQNTGKHTMIWLHRVIDKVWRTEEIPEDWRKAIIIPIHKKGDKQECNNSRGISLLSTPGKVFTRILLNRIKESVDESLRENQSGFRKGRGCSDQIFFLRQLIEKKIEFNEEVVICFIDFAQAYDSIWREGAWNIMKKYGINKKIVKLIKSLYRTVMACVRIEGEETEWFSIETGFRQGCILSPIMFNMVLDYIMRRMEKMNELGHTLKPENTEDAEYADDTCLIAECILTVMEMMEAMARESEKLGLRINNNKTKIMPVTKKVTEWPIIKREDEEISIVRSFIYLGSELNAEGGSENEIMRRIAITGAVFNRMQNNFFKRHDITMKNKLRIYNTCIRAVLTYGCESWSITKTLENKLNATENKWIRRILRISYKEHITNKEIRERTKQPWISDIIKMKRMKWTGHVVRMEKERLPKKIFEYKPTGRRARGRPKRRWIDGVEEDLKEAGLSIHGKTEGRKRMTLKEMAEDRGCWRKIMVDSMTGHSRMMDT